MRLKSSERLEDLQCGGLKIVQDKNLYTFTSDSVILANFVKTKRDDVCVEIGSGCGVVSILLQAKCPQKQIFAFEIQPQMQALCKKNIQLNGLQDKITLICDDAKNFEKYIKTASADVVFANPPYFKKTNFAQNPVKKFAKEDEKLSCADLVFVASKMLKDGGSFFCCYSPERIFELFTNCNKNNLAVKEMFFTENGKHEVKLLVIKAVKNAKFGTKVLPNLVTNDENGNYLEILHTEHFLKK